MRNEYTITKSLMKSWAKGYHLNSARNIIFLIIFCYIGIVGALKCAEILYLLGYHVIYFPEYLACVIILGCLVLLSADIIFVHPHRVFTRAYKSYSQNYCVKEWQHVTEFLDDEIVVTDHNSVYRYKYINIKRVKDRGDFVIILFKGGFGDRIYKNAFTLGSWEECKKLISEKSRVNVK